MQAENTASFPLQRFLSTACWHRPIEDKLVIVFVNLQLLTETSPLLLT